MAMAMAMGTDMAVRKAVAETTAIKPPHSRIDRDRLFRGSLSRIAVAIVSVVIAGLSLLSAAGSVLKAGSPNAALMVWPVNGFARATVALSNVSMRGDSNGSADAAAMAADVAQARSALIDEPLAEQSFVTMGMAADFRGDKKGALKFMRAAERLTRRDPVEIAWMVVDSNSRRNLPELKLSLNRSVLTNPETAQVYMPLLARTLEDDDSIPTFVDILKSRPVWELDFWRAVTVDQAALRNAGLLRAQLSRPSTDDREVTAVLLRGLANAGHFDVAEQLFRSAQLSNDGSQLVHNGDFRRATPLPVFDWDLIASGEASATIDAGRGTLQISALPEQGGSVGRQLVVLDKGKYRLAVMVSGSFAVAETSASVTLRCAVGNALLATLTVTGDRQQVDIDQTTNCRYFWMTVDAVPRDGAGDNELSLKRISLVRL